MLNKLRNKKAGVWYALLWLAPATTIFIQLGGVLAGTSYLLRHEHRERKAVEFCVKEGVSESICKEKVSQMSRQSILNYIKDDQEVTRESLNKGVFNEGRMNG